MTLLTQAVHVDFVTEQLADSLDIGGETSQAEVYVAVVEDLGEVVGNSQGLETEAEIAGDGDTVLADHGNTGTAVYQACQ